MTLSANGQRIENADSVELNSGGSGNPSLETGTDDPTSLGKVAAEGSLYMRHVPAGGECYLKTGVGDTAWTQFIVGSASVSLDQAYDSGRIITADAGPIEINNAVVDSSSCIKMTRSPGSSAAATMIDMDAGANATGNAIDLLVQNVACKALAVTNNTAPTTTHVEFDTAGLGAGGKVLRVATTAAGDATSIGVSIEMNAGHLGSALEIDAGAGKSIVATGDADITGILKMDGAQHTTIETLVDAASIATDASLANIFTVTLAGNRTLANPTNLDHGTYIWIVKQDGPGSRTLAYDTLFKFPGGITPILTTTPSATDIITAIYDGTDLLATFQANFS